MSLHPHGGLNHGPIEKIITLTGTLHLNYMNGKGELGNEGAHAQA